MPDLVQLQTGAYDALSCRRRCRPEHRNHQGLEGVMREVFPIESYDGTMELEYLGYELGSPRYTPDECRELKLTYGRPFKIRVRLKKESPVEEDVYLGEIPIMLGGGEFIVNGTERVIVTQLHRSPGVDFSVETVAADRKLHSCWIIPERGSWIELNVTKKDVLAVRIDQSGKFPATGLLRAFNEKYSTHTEIVRSFYDDHEGQPRAAAFLEEEDPRQARRGVDLRQGDGRRDRRPDLAPRTRSPTRCWSASPTARSAASSSSASSISEREKKYDEVIERGREKWKYGVKESTDGVIEVIKDVDDQLVLTTLREDTTESHDEALLRIYARLRPGQPAEGREGPRALPREVLRSSSRYRLGRVGRFRLNRKFKTNRPEDEETLHHTDLVNAVQATWWHCAGRPRPSRARRASRRRSAARSTSMTSTTWATAASARSPSWRPTRCARASSSSAARPRSA